MTLIDENMPSPPRSPSPSSSSPEHVQLDKINAAVDTTLSEFSSLQQRVASLLAHVVGLRWKQQACDTKLSYTMWKEMTKQASQLTYAVAGTDEALMRHLFSLDAIMGDDDIRILRRTCVHRIKHAITQVERYTTYMYKIMYWIKKWLKHDDEEQEQSRMETDEPTSSKPVSSSVSPAPHPSSSAPSKHTPMSPPLHSSTLQPPITKSRSNSLPAHHTPIKTSRSVTSSPVLKGKKTSLSTPGSPNLTLKGKKIGSKTSTKSPTLTSKTASPTLTSKTASPTLTPKTASPKPSPQKSTPASPQLPHRHIPPQPAQPAPPTSPRFSVSHDSTHITITALLPGVIRDSLDVTVRGHMLRIVGICQGENFVREMELPETCDVDEMDAAWEEQTDTLKIRVPIGKKQTQKQQPQQQQTQTRQQPQPQAQTRQQPQQQPRSQQQQPSRPSSRHVPDQDMEEDDDADDMDVSHPYYSHQPMSSSRCAPSYARPSYHPSYTRRPVYAAPPRSMFGYSPFGGFW